MNARDGDCHVSGSCHQTHDVTRDTSHRRLLSLGSLRSEDVCHLPHVRSGSRVRCNVYHVSRVRYHVRHVARVSPAGLLQPVVRL